MKEAYIYRRRTRGEKCQRHHYLTNWAGSEVSGQMENDWFSLKLPCYNLKLSAVLSKTDEVTDKGNIYWQIYVLYQLSPFIAKTNCHSTSLRGCHFKYFRVYNSCKYYLNSST